jgi:iron(III) transport system substrate-binding protein
MTPSLYVQLLASCLGLVATAADRSLSHASSPDRMERLITAAKKEGVLTFYTSISEKDLPPLIEPFEKKYGIKVTAWRAAADKVLQRTIAETRAKKYEVDAIHAGSSDMEALSRENILQPVNSPVHKELVYVPSHREYAVTRLSVFVQAYNTNAVKKEDLPKSYHDLLDPKWKGKLGIEYTDYEWFAYVAEQAGGTQLFKDIVAKNGISVRKGHTLLGNLVVAGEVPLALTIYDYHAAQEKRRGSPIDWIVIEPAVTRSNAVGITKTAPHPNAALLFYEYMLSSEAQRTLLRMDYVPGNTTVERPERLKGLPLKLIDPVDALDKRVQWEQTFHDTVAPGVSTTFR